MNWMFPYAVSTTTTAPSEPDCSSSLALSACGDHQELDSASPSSAASFSSSSSSSDDHFTFATSAQRSPSASPLCFGAGKLLWRSSNGGARAHAPRKQQEEADAAPKGDVVGRYLRKISRRLRKARAAAKEPSPASPLQPCRGGAAADDTARERAEALSSAVAYCKASLRRRGASTARPASSLSLDRWLQGWQEEVIASEECTESQSLQPPQRHAAWLLERHAKATLRKQESPRLASPSRDDVSPTASAVVVVLGKESPHHGRDTGDKLCDEAATAHETAKSSSPSDHHARREFNMSGSFDDTEFLKTSNAEEEIIGRHFITIRI